MQTFRHHHTGQVTTVSTEDEIAEYDADALWQRIETPEPEPEQSLDDIVAELGHASPDHRNLLREALAQFDDEPEPSAQYDPAAHSVAEVNEYLVTADLDETSRVLAAEAEGKARAGIVAGPHAAQS